MSKKIELAESAIPSEFTINLLDHYQMNWVPGYTADFYRVVFFTIAQVLRHFKSKSTGKAGFILKDFNGGFKFGAIVTYHNPEEESNDDDDKGNFTLEFTLDEKDMEGIEVIQDNHSDVFITSAAKQAQDIMSGRFVTGEYCSQLFLEAVDTLVKFLDANAIEGEEFELTYRGIFTATVTVENGEKIISIVPGEMIKQFIKGDNSLSK